MIKRLKNLYNFLPSFLILVGLFYFNLYVINQKYADDAYIFFRYAENLHLGYGLNFNVYERVEGYTSLLWALCLFTSYWLNLLPEQFAKLLGFLFGVLTLYFTARISFKTLKTEKHLWILPPIALIFNYCFLYTTSSGLDQPLFTSLFLAAFYTQHFKEKAFFTSNVLWSLTVLTRPEGISFWILSTFLKEKPKLISSNELKNFMGALGKQSMPFIVYIIYTYIRYQYYGYILPNTAYLKIGNPPFILIENGILYIKTWLKSGIAPIIIANLIIAFKLFNNETEKFDDIDKKIITFILFWIVYIIYIGGDWIPGFRFMSTILPFIFIFFTKNLNILLTKKNIIFLWLAFIILSILSVHEIYISNLEKSFLIFTGIIFILLTVFFFSKIKNFSYWFFLFVSLPLPLSIASNNYFQQSIQEQSHISIYLKAIGFWFKQNIPQNYQIALNPAGAVPYFSKLATLDMLGLNDVTIAHTVQNNSVLNLGHDKVAPEYITMRSPEIILPGLFWLTTSPSPKGFEIQSNLKRYPIDKALFYSKDFRSMYCLMIVSNHNINFSFDNQFMLPSNNLKPKPFLHFYVRKDKKIEVIKQLSNKKNQLAQCVTLFD